jgi:formylglycine-generating enzyme required for sulfatase activity
MKPIPGGVVRLPTGGFRLVGSYHLDVRPVSNADYTLFIQATGAAQPPWMHRPGFGEPEQPIVGVTLTDARRYARWAGKRLPSAAEWVRAGTGTDRRCYPWGEGEPDASLAHFGCGRRGGPSPVEDVTHRRGRGGGPFGHFDLLGNVWEWCTDGVARGGFWGSERLTMRLDLETEPLTVSGGIGFRCAR